MALPDKSNSLVKPVARPGGGALGAPAKPTRPAPPLPAKAKRVGLRMAFSVAFAALVVFSGVGLYWDEEPDQFDVQRNAIKYADVNSNSELALGYTFSATLLRIAETLVEKPGGLIFNDIFPPGILIDDIQNWEKGALLALRDATTILRNQFARDQSQSKENPYLAVAEPQFYYRMDSWAFPDSESEYRKGYAALRHYMDDLAAKKPDAKFFDNSENLRIYMETVLKRFGDYAQRLSASADHVPERHLTVAERQAQGRVKTPWFAIDDIFFEARGYSWALSHILRAILIDCVDTVETRNIRGNINQMIGSLDEALEPILVPIVLNGSGYGLFANYSLTMSSYVSRASAAATDVRNLLLRG